MSTAVSTVASAVAAWVDGRAITVAEVDERLARVRTAGFGARLPQPHTAEGRNARRWVVQLLCAERLVDAELAARGIGVTDRARCGRGPLAVGRALGMGGVAGAMWTLRPEVSALVAAWDVVVGDDAARAYFDRNRDRFPGRDFAEVRVSIAEEMLSSARERAFSTWLDGAMAQHVRLEPGYEHPADPRHPDATHHH